MSSVFSRLSPEFRLALGAFVACVLVSATLSGCGSRISGLTGLTGDTSGSGASAFRSEEPNVADPGTFGDVYRVFGANNCAQCHGPGLGEVAHGAQLDLSSQAAAYASLVGPRVSATDSVGSCGAVNLVSPGSAETSYLAATLGLVSVAGDFVQAGCAPFNGHAAALAADEGASVLAWIRAGAPNN